MIRVPDVPVERSAIVAAAREYLGVPFRYHGRNRLGLDCVGLLWVTTRDLGYEIDDNTSYTRDPQGELINAKLEEISDPVPTNELRLGQIVKLRQSVYPMHVGILGRDQWGRFTVINANIKRKAVIEQSISEWASLIMGVRELKGVA